MRHDLRCDFQPICSLRTFDRRLVGAAYGFIWVMVAGFVFTVWRRTDLVERDIEVLRSRIDQAKK